MLVLFLHRKPGNFIFSFPLIRLNETFGEIHAESGLIQKTRDIFAPGGHLARTLNLESRPEQDRMAIRTAEAFSADRPLFFEAGTGVGKSLAYLIPALIQATDRDRQCIVSTKTIALQEQIQRKDLPICRTLFEKVPTLSKYGNFKAALLVGRANYLCGTRLARALAAKADLFPGPKQIHLENILDWSRLTVTGLRHEISPSPPHEVWEWVNSDSTSCNRRNCSPANCFFQRARDDLRKAQIIIVNHSLLFALINAGLHPGPEVKGVLLSDDFVVLDEAHTVAQVATQHFGQRITSYGLDRLLKRIFNPRNRYGLLGRLGTPSDRNEVERAITAAQAFFTGIGEHVLGQRSIVRVHAQGWFEASLLPCLERLVKRLGVIVQDTENESLGEEIHDLRARLVANCGGLEDCLNVAQADSVYWVERSGSKGQVISLRTAPIDVAPYLREGLFRRSTAVLLTSATLGARRDVASFATTLGAESAQTGSVSSPFDFAHNMAVYIATDAPAPSRHSGQLDIEFLADAVAYCTLAFSGGSLVLFTSYADMREVATRNRSLYAEAGRELLIQGSGPSRTQLTSSFAHAGNASLYGTDSFWVGVDVPGPSLSQVIVTRLPFENPSHPIQEARSEWIRRQGGSPFLRLTLPDAVVKFRQGIGRLIRNKTDRGTITILDSRILYKPYGREFLALLPHQNFTRFKRADRDWAFQPLEAASAS